MGNNKGLGRIVIVGNSVAGLLTAAALADHADGVTLIDRDQIPAEPEHRPGVPQGRHIHVLLAAGQRNIEALLPGMMAEFGEHDVPAVGTPLDVMQLQRGHWVRRAGRSPEFLTATRPLLEHAIRQRVLADPRIKTMNGIEAVGLIGDRAQVRGLLIRRRATGPRLETDQLLADLVVDASGRSSRTPEWLNAIGAKSPTEDRIDSGLCYTTRMYQAPIHPGYKGIYLIPHPGSTRGAVVMPIEKSGVFLVTLSGLAGDEPPTDPSGFESFASQLPHSVVHDWIMAARPLGSPMGFRGTANVRRAYHRLAGRPRGLLVVGDAACSFNPVYGQGITVAATAAMDLRRALARGQRTTRRLQGVVAASAVQAWAISSSADKRMPGATGNAIKPMPADRFADWYLARVEAHSTGNLSVGAAFRDVLHLLAPVTSLFSWRVMRAVMFSRIQQTSVDPPVYPE